MAICCGLLAQSTERKIIDVVITLAIIFVAAMLHILFYKKHKIYQSLIDNLLERIGITKKNTQEIEELQIIESDDESVDDNIPDVPGIYEGSYTQQFVSTNQ